VFGECKKRSLPLVIGGDVFDVPTVSEALKNVFVAASRGTDVYAIAGQHDLPYHSWKNVNKSSFGVLWNTGIIKSLEKIGRFAHWGEDVSGKETGLLFLHTLVYEFDVPFYLEEKAVTAQELLKKYPRAKYIFCGDNHSGFVYTQDSRSVIVSGCLNRQTTDKKEYLPKILIIDTETGRVEHVFVPDATDIVDDRYLVKRHERDGRIVAFAAAIKGSKALSLDFKKNVEVALVGQIFKNDNTKSIIQGVIQ
jgi:DNA repair exonuclease SbcCD nuclease subunit